jgi:hypothetical protein
MSRTLLSLRTELAQRLGFSASGTAAIAQEAILNSALRSAQDQLFYEFGDLLTKKINDAVPGTTTSGTAYYPFPTDCDPYKPLTISIQRQGTGRFYEMQIGIGVHRHNELPVLNQMDPVRWDVIDDSGVAKIEVWPVPNDSTSAFRLEYNAGLTTFSSDTDTATVNPQLILLHSITTMKAHYRQPDYEIYANQLQQLLGRIKTIGLVGGGSYRRYTKRTANFFLDPGNDMQISTQSQYEIASIIAKTYVTSVDSGSGSDYIVTS